jgi:hypothetical protein
MDATQSQCGIHLRTALTACQIISYNKPGYFTAARERTARRITGPADHIISAGIYYYHLQTEGSDSFYPICRDFRCWSFPHDALPAEWAPNEPISDIIHTHWSVLSQRVKDRDVKCLVSGGRDSLDTAHVVPKAEEPWVCGMSCQCSIANFLLATI